MSAYIKYKENNLSVFGFITRAVFGLDVTEKNGVVRISGIKTHQLIEDINKTFGTTRVTVNMFTKATSSYVEFYSFFLIDIEYIVRRLSKVKTTKLGKRGYVKMQEALVENTWLSDLNKEHPSIFNKSKLKEIKFDLLKHQSEFLDYYDRVIPKYNLRGLLMAATPGSGKTISSIGIACAFESKNVIVVAPKNSVFRVWEKTLLEDMNVEQTVWVHASKKPIPNTSDCRWFIFHYESLEDAMTLASKLSSERCTVILDESHNLNEMKSLRTERFVNMCKTMKNSLIVELSGTPMKAMGAEAIPLISAIDPLFTDDCVVKFKKIYGREAKAATEILANRLGIIMYKVNKEESKIEEPIEHTIKVQVKDSEKYTLDAIKLDMSNFIKQRTEHYNANKKTYEKMYNDGLAEFEKVGLTKLTKPEQYETYKRYIKEFIKSGYDPRSSAPKATYCNDFEKKIIQPSLSQKTRKDFKNAKSVVKYVNLKIRGECLGTVLSRARMNCNKSILESLNLSELIDGAEKKTLVFTSYVEIVKATSEKLKAEGYSPLSVFAETNNNLPAMVKQFDKDESINPMIATYQSLSTAVPLTMANRVILLNAPFRIHEKEQTVARANRIGQNKTVDVYNILLDTGDTPNISTRSSDIMEWSREQVNAIMGFDNSDNAIALESYLQEDECMLDLDEEVQEIVSTESITTTDVPVTIHTQNVVALEHRFNSAMNQINTITNFIDCVYTNIGKGQVLNPIALEMYNLAVSPDNSNLSFESHQSNIQITVLSLEDQNKKGKSVLSKLADLFMTLFKSVLEYLNDSNRLFKANIEKSKELKRHITAGKTRAFSNAKGQVEVNMPLYLVRRGSVNAINHVNDYKWQTKATRTIVDILNSDFKSLSRDFNNHLVDISATPGLNQMPAIMNRIKNFNKLLINASVSSNEQGIVYTGEVNMGGRQFVLRTPNHGDSDYYIKNFSTFKLRHTVVDNTNINNDAKVEALSRAQAMELLDLIIINNQQLSYVNTFINSVNSDVKSFINNINRVSNSDKIDAKELAIITPQASLMLNVLKSLTMFTANYVKINDRASKSSINYINSSAKGYIEIT